MSKDTSDTQVAKITYKDSGVDVEKADQMVDWMKSDLSKIPDSHPDRLVGGLGGFAALFDAKFPDCKNPALVSSTDGIGTKLLMGLESKKTSGLAQDLVGMCVNDLVCMGATPLFFLDYFASSSLEEAQLKEFLLSLKKACYQSGVSLVGGETAELPGLYHKGHFDAAGFSVGVVDREKAWSAEKVQVGDVLLGVKSSGFHSNGYSLLRKAFGEDGGEYSKELMSPTRLYWPLIKKIKDLKLDTFVHSCAHITGGGLDNLLRVLPNFVEARINDWEWPHLVKVAQEKTSLNKEEMLKTFNCGVGLVLVVDKLKAEDMKKLLVEDFEMAFEGEVVEQKQKAPQWSTI